MTRPSPIKIFRLWCLVDLRTGAVRDRREMSNRLAQQLNTVYASRQTGFQWVSERSLKKYQPKEST